jgi:hypothetical protein
MAKKSVDYEAQNLARIFINQFSREEALKRVEATAALDGWTLAQSKLWARVIQEIKDADPIAGCFPSTGRRLG